MSSKHLAKGSKMPAPNRGKLRLYSNRFCPYSQRVLLVLDAKKLQYEVVNINLSNKPDWLYQISPLGKIPALELENGEVLYESLIIADYLDEKYHQHPLHHKDPLRKAKDKILIEEFSKVVSTMYRVLQTANQNMNDCEDTIMSGLEIFEKELASRPSPYFGGSVPGMLDYMIWPWCERADLLKLFGNEFVLRKDKYRKLLEWRITMREDPAVRKSMLDIDTHTKFLQSHRAGFPEYDMVLSQ